MLCRVVKYSELVPCMRRHAPPFPSLCGHADPRLGLDRSSARDTWGSSIDTSLEGRRIYRLSDVPPLKMKNATWNPSRCEAYLASFNTAIQMPEFFWVIFFLNPGAESLATFVNMSPVF